jgi:outer membrane protein
MKRFSLLVAAVLGALNSVPAAAQPRGRAQADTGTSPSVPDDEDGPEAKGVALFKLDDLIEVAVRLSPDVARARTDREIGRHAADASRKDQSWVLSASANAEVDALGADTPDTLLQPLQVLKDNKITGTIGLGRNLPTGGNIAFELGLLHETRELNVTGEVLAQAGMQQTNCGENVDVFCQNQASAKLTLKQPLLRGLGSDIALAPERKADLAAVETTIKAQLAAEEMIRDLVSAYWDLAYAAYEVDVRAKSLQAANEQDALTRQELRAGTAAQNALDAVGYEIALRDEALLTAKLTFEKKSLDLRRKAGLEIGRRDIVVRPADPLEIDAVDWDIDDILAKSHKINRQVASLVLEKKMADVAHDATLPQVDLSLSGALLGNGDTSGGAFNAVSGGDGYGYQVMAGLTMSFELSGAAKSAQAAAVAKRHRLDIDRVDLERQIDAEVVSSVKTLMSGRTRVALADKAIRIANANFLAERANFLAQHSTNFQVMQRQTQTLDAELRRGRAVADYRIAVVQLQYLSGTLLDAYRIHVRARTDGAADAARPARPERSERSARSTRSARSERSE